MADSIRSKTDHPFSLPVLAISLPKKIIRRGLFALGYEISPIRKGRKGTTTDPIRTERSAHEYDRIWSNEGILDSYLSEERRSLYNEIIRFAKNAGIEQNVGSIADMGCGPGFFTQMLAEELSPARLAGYDFSASILEHAQERCPTGVFKQHDIYQRLEEAFDLLFCTEVLEHLLYPERALDNLTNAAQRLVLSVPNGRIDNYAGHIHYWSLESWKVFLERYANNWDYGAEYLSNQNNIVTWMNRRMAPATGHP